ncbi:hypothetical protein V8E36_002807 [Tilletia maclaganii]
MNDDLVAQFCDVTGASAETARATLSASNDDLAEAVATHFAAQEAAADDIAEHPPGAEATAAGDAQLAQALAASTQDSAADDKPQGPFSSTDPWDHTASASAGAAARGGPTGFRNPAAGLGNVFGGGRGGSGPSSGGGSSSGSRNAPTSSSRPGGIHTFRDLAAGRAGGSSGGGGVGGGSNAGGARIKIFRDLAAGNDGPSVGGGGGGGFGGFPGMGGFGGGGPGHGHAHDDDDDDDDEPMDDPVNFYTGGKRSGLSVQNPDHLRRRAPAPNDLVGNILKQAAEAGARPGPPGGGDLGDAAAGSSSASQSFAGSGRTLAGPSADETAAAAGGEGTTGGDAEEEAADLPTAVRYLTFWANGYTLSEEGPLRSYDDPQDAAVLRAIEAQRAPLDVLGVQPNQPVELRVAKRLGEKWSPPPPGPTRAFEGSGQRLGAPVPGDAGPSTSSASASATTTTTTSAPANSSAGPPSSHAEFEVDRSQPTTQIQIRLAEGGERIVATLNHTHTIGDLRRYINASRPGMADRAYTLNASFPPKPLPSDETVTIKDAGLLSAVVIQRWA